MTPEVTPDQGWFLTCFPETEIKHWWEELLKTKATFISVPAGSPPHLWVPQWDMWLVVTNSQEELLPAGFHDVQQAYGLLSALNIRQSPPRHFCHIHWAHQVGIKFSIFSPTSLQEKKKQTSVTSVKYKDKTLCSVTLKPICFYQQKNATSMPMKILSNAG